MRKILLGCAAAAIVGFAHGAQANVITFDQVAVDPVLGSTFDEFIEDGLKLTTETVFGGALDQVLVLPNSGNPDNAALLDGIFFEDEFTVMSTNGMPINFDSLDLACNNNCSGDPNANLVSIQGNGGSNPMGLLPVPDSYQPFVFSDAWNGLDSVTFSAQAEAEFSVDNITAQVVPLPAAGWAMLAGVGALAGLRRRAARKAAA